MQNKLSNLSKRIEELNMELSQEGATKDMERFKKISKEHSDILPVVDIYKDYLKFDKDITEAKDMLNDPEMKAFAQSEIDNGKKQLERIEKELQVLLIPKDLNDEKNIFLEIRAGAGGDESALFVGDIFRMYSRFVERMRWQIEIISTNEAEVGGYKEVIIKINGAGAYSKLKFESGGHRVQRVPDTETQGRIHTSAATVAVLPEAEEVDIKINDSDLRIDVFRAGGPGGQSVNTTDSAVRITHIPTGLSVSQQDQKSQHKNKAKGMLILRSRLYELERSRIEGKRSEDRKSKIGTGDRSERIRTYNFPQGRVTDHRINLTLHKLEAFLEGEVFDEMVESLTLQAQEEKLSNLN